MAKLWLMNLESITLDPSNANFPFKFFLESLCSITKSIFRYQYINTKGIAEGTEENPFYLGWVNVKDKNDGAELPEADGEQSFCKGNRILESRKFWSVEFGIRKKMLVESGIQLKETSFIDKDWNSV